VVSDYNSNVIPGQRLQHPSAAPGLEEGWDADGLITGHGTAISSRLKVDRKLEGLREE
jgi:hypothetical protein